MADEDPMARLRAAATEAGFDPDAAERAAREEATASGDLQQACELIELDVRSGVDPAGR